MDSGNLINIRSNVFSLKEDKTDVLETPQIGKFKHENENENVNIFSFSFKQEISKKESEDLARLNSLTTLASPYTNEIAFIDPSEHQQQQHQANSLAQTSTPPLIGHSSSQQQQQQQQHDSSKSAPKKKFLERTISQNDADLLSMKPDACDLHHSASYMRQSSQTSEKNLKRSASSKDVLEDVSSKVLKTTSNIHNTIETALHLPIVQSIIDYQKRPNSNVSASSNSLTSNDKSHCDKKPTIDNILKNADYLNSNTKMNRSTLHIKPNQPSVVVIDDTATRLQQQSDKPKQKEDMVTSSVPETEKKPKSKRSIMMNSDLRKQQIRNSNREAARRCRERRSNYIKTLENKITVLEAKQKQLISENSGLYKQVHDLKQIIDHSNLGYNSHNNNFNQVNSNFGAIFPNNGQIKGVPLVLTVEIPNGGALNGAHVVNNTTNNIRQIANALNGSSLHGLKSIETSQLMNNQELFKQVVDSLHYRSPQTHLIDSQSQPQSTKINK